MLAAVTDAKLMKKAIKNLKNSFIDFMKESTNAKRSSGNIKDAESSEEIQDQVSFSRSFNFFVSLLKLIFDVFFLL